MLSSGRVSGRIGFATVPLGRGISVAALAALALAAAPAPAAAQSLFDLLFNGGRPFTPPTASAYANPQADVSANPSDPGPRADTGPTVSYCVRLCDGRFFPIQRSAATPADICNSFCPAAKTKIYSGGSIDHAVARDGSHYGDLATAFVYRTMIVPGCTCNGRDAFGLVDMKAADDPTLRQGDVVATNDGFVAYSGPRKRGGDFTPIAAATGVSSDTRRALAATRIRPASNSPASSNTAASGRDGSDRQAQLTR